MCVRACVRGDGSPPGTDPVRYVKTVSIFLAAGPDGAGALPEPSGTLEAAWVPLDDAPRRLGQDLSAQ
eukprot:10288208-Alexandrium_andersonii.AAC.1